MFGAPKFDTTFNENGTVTLKAKCRFTKKDHSVTVPEVGYRQWITGQGNIQSIMPTVSAEDREFLISGYSPEGWQQLFGDEEDE